MTHAKENWCSQRSRFRRCRPADSTWVDRTAGWSAGGPSGIFSVARVLGRRSSEMSRRRRGLHRRVLARRCRPLPPPLVPGAVWRHEPGPPRTRTRRNPRNSVTLIGRLTANPQTHAGEKHESATFRLAVPRPGTDGADFVDIVCFDKLAATCAERNVGVLGFHRVHEWTELELRELDRFSVEPAGGL